MIATDAPGFQKDRISVLNTDNTALDSYRKQKHLFRTIKTLESRINTLEQRIATIETANGTSNST